VAEAPAPSFEQIVAAMRDAGFYPGSEGPVEVHETHISWVFLVGERAYKLKKPVALPFLDYSTAARRREMCEREVELNRRLAGDVYLGVRPVAISDGRPQLGAQDDRAVEWVVEMRRFDPSFTLAATVAAGTATEADVAAVARRIAAFHADAPIAVRAGTVSAIKRAADGNFEALLDDREPVARARVFAAQRFVDAFLEGHGAEIAARAAAGRVRDGHGDLRAEHVLPGEPVRVVDCAEFDARLRHLDVGADISFLVMDLAALGRPDLARALVQGYRDAGGDPGPDPMIAFHAANRAWVRAKIALTRADQPGAPAGCREEALDRFALGERLAWRARLPLAVIVCGAPAAGKSALARALSAASGLEVVSSDETRKRLAGLLPTQRAPQEAYGDEASLRTYTALGEAAAQALARDGGVIADATCGRAHERRALLAALPAAVVVECRVPAAVAAARARARQSDPGAVSDATPAVAARLRAGFEPLEDDVRAADHLVLRTDQPLERALADLTALLDRRLAAGAAPVT